MEKNRLFLFGTLLKIAGYVLYGIGVIVAVGIVSAGHKISRIGFNLELFLWFISLLLALFLSVGVIKVGHYLHLHGKKLIVKHKAIIFSNSETKNTVLYLRSFKDDDITSITQAAYQIRGIDLPQLTTEEEILANEFNRFGKFISAANPNANLPNPGAIQIDLKEKEWKERINNLMKTSTFVLLRIGKGEHLKWEIDQAIKLVLPHQKLLFLIPNNEDVYHDFKERLKLNHSIDLPDIDISTFFGNATISAIIYFANDFISKVSICQNAGYRSSSSKPLKPILRYMLKPIYEQLCISWRPPYVPKEKYIPVIFFSYLTGLCLVWALPDLSFFFSLYAILPLHIPLLVGVLGLYWAILNLIKTIKQNEVPLGDLSNEVGKQWKIPEANKPFYKRFYDAWISGELAFLGKNYESVTNLSFNDFYDLFRPVDGNSISIYFKDFPAPLLEEYLVLVNDFSDENDEPWFVLTNFRLIQKNGTDNVFHQIWIKDIERIETSGFWTKKLAYHLKSGDTIIFKKVDVYASEDYINLLLSH